MCGPRQPRPTRGRPLPGNGDVGVKSRDESTIRDFGDQWRHHTANEGYYASIELLRDMLGPLLSLDALRGARVADIGSGTGRIVGMLLEAGARKVVAVEPSVGVDSLRENTAEFGDRVQVIHGAGDELPAGLELDFVTAIGVIQFIPDPGPTLRASYAALRPGGQVIVWVYGREGSGPYLALLDALRGVSTRLPHGLLMALCHLLTLGVDAYTLLCRASGWRLPLSDYLVHTLARVSRRERTLTIYDQLNPRFVRYYRRSEVQDLLESAGFSDVALFHRRGYSWTATGVKRTSG